MKLGISYAVFDGDELLEYAIRSIRDVVDFVSVVWQSVSYFNQPAPCGLLSRLQKLNLIDEIVHHDQDFTIGGKANELNIRNTGVRLSAAAGCTHHISADVDEFYQPDQLSHVKHMAGGRDCIIVGLTNYYKRPTYQIVPDQNHLVSFIHPVDNMYSMSARFPVRIEITRRLNRSDRYLIIPKEKFVIHHMTYVRKNIRRKLENSPTGQMVNIDKFVAAFDKYHLGDRLCIAPDFCNRKTVLAPNIFNIEDHTWEHHQ